MGKFQEPKSEVVQSRPCVINPGDEAKKIDEATELKIEGPPAQIEIDDSSGRKYENRESIWSGRPIGAIIHRRLVSLGYFLS